MFRNTRVLVLACGLVACVPTPPLVPYPDRAADLYPLSQTIEGVSVAVDAVEGTRTRRYFGEGLLARRILPVTVVVSNLSSHEVHLGPEDVLLWQGQEVIDPVPAPVVARLTQPLAGGRAIREAERYFEGLGFHETVLSPGQSYHGVMFFLLPPPSSRRVPYSSLPVFVPDSRLQVQVAARATTLTRLRFGPFALPAGEEDGR